MKKTDAPFRFQSQSKPSYAVIAAAGTGSRMGHTENKQFMMLEGIPVIVRTLRAFQLVPSIRGLVVVAAPDECKQMEAVIEPYGLTNVLRIVEGGSTRSQSVYHGLQALFDSMHPASDTPVLVHDGARCLVRQEVIQRVLDGIIEYGCCGAGVPVKDTIKQVTREGIVRQTLDRNQLWSMQTPQGASWQHLSSAYNTLDMNKPEVTDDLSVLEQAGYPVKLVMGDYQNIKLTTPEDVCVASAFIRKSDKSSV
jgi:2-C-methyl-D-erythritol 4-phosphate cytidylyltransferase